MRLLLYSMILASTYTIAQSPPQQQSQISVPPVSNIVINVSPTITTNTEGKMSSAVINEQKVVQYVSQEMTQLYTSIVRMCDATRDYAKIVADETMGYAAKLYAHPWLSVGTCVLVAYGLLTIYIWRSVWYMRDKRLWTHWHQEKSLIDLCEVAGDDLKRDLLNAIYSRYMNGADPTDNMTPLTSFLVDIALEETRINTLLTVLHVVKTMCLRKCVYGFDGILSETERALERLAFIKHQFLSWTVAHNLRRIEKCSFPLYTDKKA